MTRRWVVILTILFVLAAFAGPMVVFVGGERGQAAFGDEETFGLNELEAASLDIEIGETTILLDASNMAPGDQLVGRLAFDNEGTLPLRYALISEVAGPDSALLADLQWSIWVARPQNDCSSIPAATLFSGVVSGGRLLGDPTIGPDPGDRLLAPGESESFCVVVELPLEVPDTVQGSRGQIDLIVIGEQATEPNP